MTVQTSTLTVAELVSMRDKLLLTQRELYLTAVANINMRNRELLKDDFGKTLVKNCAWDAADQIVNSYFNTADFYISPQQMYDRIVDFSYDSDSLSPIDDMSIRKMLYENENSADLLHDIMTRSEEAGEYLFSVDRKKDPLEKETKRYRQEREAAGDIKDDITGKEGSTYVREKNGKEESVSTLHADHIQARDSIKYNSRYIDKSRLDDLRAFYYSDNNFWLIDASANSSKGAVRICKVDDKAVIMSDKEYKAALKKGTITEKNDITWKATAEEMANATIEMWERDTASGKKIENLKEKGYLDENGKVLPGVEDKLVKAYKKAMNAESRRMILPYYEEKNGKKVLKMPWLNYANIAKDAGNDTKKALKKIVVGQVIYYVLPPVVFETQMLTRKKGMTLDHFFKEIQLSGKRIIRYAINKLGEMFKRIVGNAVNKFVKTFFDIIIEVLKETVKRIVKIVKQLVLSLINCIKVVLDKRSSPAEKADAVTKTLAVTITSIVLEVIFEWAEKQFGLPDILMEPLQMIVTILATNLVMLILEKLDLFSVKYGLLEANIKKIFDEEYQTYLENSDTQFHLQEEQMNIHMDNLKIQIDDINRSIETLDLYEDDCTEELKYINEIYHMGIDFEKEWQDYVAIRR